jgi:hypothetical protein
MGKAKPAARPRQAKRKATPSRKKPEKRRAAPRAPNAWKAHARKPKRASSLHGAQKRGKGKRQKQGRHARKPSAPKKRAPQARRPDPLYSRACALEAVWNAHAAGRGATLGEMLALCASKRKKGTKRHATEKSISNALKRLAEEKIVCALPQAHPAGNGGKVGRAAYAFTPEGFAFVGRELLKARVKKAIEICFSKAHEGYGGDFWRVESGTP